jgi:hypothetical protein
MKTYSYQTEASVVQIEKYESVKKGSKLKDGNALIEYNPPVWIIKTGPPMYLTVTVEKEPPFKAGAVAKIIVEVESE